MIFHGPREEGGGGERLLVTQPGHASQLSDRWSGGEGRGNMGIVGQRKTSPRQTRTSITGLFRLGGDTPSCNGDPWKIGPISGANANLDQFALFFFFLLHYIYITHC